MRAIPSVMIAEVKVIATYHALGGFCAGNLRTSSSRLPGVTVPTVRAGVRKTSGRSLWSAAASGFMGPSLTGVLQVGQVGDRRPHAEILQDLVAAVAPREHGHAAVLVFEVAEDDGLCGAGRRAGGDDLPVAEGPVLALGLHPRVVDALDAEGALLHDAARAHG